MAFREQWRRHLVAVLRGEAGSNELARDFWPSEDLWVSSVPVTCRWFKLLWVYFASVFFQAVVPVLLSVPLIHLYKGVAPILWVLGPAIMIGAALVVAVLFATAAYHKVASRD